MPFHFSDEAVLWTYHNDRRSDYDPSQQKLDSWDQQLVDTYEQALVDILPEFNLPLDKRTKSRILQLTIVSNGQSVRTQVRNACKFHSNVTG